MTETNMNTIAMVGAHQPMTHDDGMRLSVAEQYGWIQDLDWRSANLDIINLEYGRDFLAEEKKYTTVILHSLFHTRPEYLSHKSLSQLKSCGVSRLHTLERWRERLVNTGAHAIIVWELKPFALSGWQLDELPGYSIHERNHRVTVYYRRGRGRP